MDTHYFVVPFAEGGDKASIPEGTQVDGSISYTQGYGPFYALDPEVNPSAILINRQTFNELMFDITSALSALQSDYPQWIDATDNGGSPFAYNLGATVRYTDGALWYSLVAANAATPGTDPTKWVLFGSLWATTVQLNAEIARAMAAESLLAPLASPALTGNPTAPTQPPGTLGNLLATCGFVSSAVAAETARAIAAEALLAPKNNPTFTGPNVIVPLYAPGDSSGRVAATGYVDAAVAVERNRAISAEGLLAPLASPALTGTPTTPTPPPTSNDNTIPDTAWVQALLGGSSGGFQPTNPGWLRIGECIVQFGNNINLPTGNGDVVPFPITFPNAVLSVVVSSQGGGTSWADCDISNPAYFLAWNFNRHFSANPHPGSISYIAIGY